MTERDELIEQYLYYKKQILRSLPLNELKNYDNKIREIRQEFREKFNENIDKAIHDSNYSDFIN